MSLTNYVTVGRSGLRVSPIALGAMTFGEDWGWGSTVEDSIRIMDRYIELGGNFIDTANGYTKTHSEKIIGDHLGSNAARRQRIVLSTKFSTNNYPGDPNGGGSSRKAIIDACEQSLRRLQTDYIDLYWMHNYDPHTPIEETMMALETLVQAGKIRYIGVSDTPAWKIAQANTLALLRSWSPFVAMQIEYSLLERTVEQELIPLALDSDIAVMPWSPLRTGLLSGKFTRESAGKNEGARSAGREGELTEQTYDLIDELGRIAQSQEASIARIALAWVMQRPGVKSTIIGARTMAQLEDNTGAADIILDSAELERLNDMTTPTPTFPRNIDAIGASVRHAGTTINGEFAPIAPGFIEAGDTVY